MLEPLSNKPKLTNVDIRNGFITRYFVRHISIPTIIEIDKKQYDIFKSHKFYITTELRWVISGFANNTTTTDGNILYGVKHINTVAIDFCERKLPGIKEFLRNPLEYFIGVDNSTQ